MTEHKFTKWLDYVSNDFPLYRLHVENNGGQYRWRYEYKSKDGRKRSESEWKSGKPLSGWNRYFTDYKEPLTPVNNDRFVPPVFDEDKIHRLEDMAKKIDKLLRTEKVKPETPDRPWISKPETQNNKKITEKWKTTNE